MRNIASLTAKTHTHTVSPASDGGWDVVSGSSGNTYHVRYQPELEGYSCTCRWALPKGGSNCHRPVGCSHVMAAVAFHKLEQDRKVAFKGDLESARRQHRPISDLGQGILAVSRRIA